MKADIAVIPTLVDTEGYMSYSQLAELYKAGWDMLNHTYDHVELGYLSKQEQQDEIEKGRDWLKDHKLTRGSDVLIYPNGSYSGLTIQILKKEKIEAARSLNSLWVSRTGSSLENTDICNLYSYIIIDRVQEAIDKAANNNGTVIIMLHKIEPVTDDTNMQIDEDTFKEVVSRLSKSGLNILTLSELLSVKNNEQTSD
jgi:peptidoglycan/xylan/chitin deacetylase (PgdA/CDA1 family)